MSDSPKFDLTLPMYNGSFMSREDDPKAEAIELASIGSPLLVPVPWHSTKAVSVGSKLAAA